ncbi:FUSC family protein [Embleya sp. NBC_00896]|uniref:FUSC family protein n=1 Tax=Embleya sp. NBC_00896 TaxID=2975961 RepID=UPI003867CA88|nr:FUSC family protein [Embleya sp. NBC_00896]
MQEHATPGPHPERAPLALPPGPSADPAGPPTLPPFPAVHPPELDPNAIKPLVTLTGKRFNWAAGARAALGVGIPFAIVTATLGIDDATFAALGGYAVLYAAKEPYARRGITLALVGLGLTLSLTLGSLAAGTAFLYVPVITLVATVATFLCGALQVDRPGGYMFTLVCAMGAFLPHQPDLVPQRAGLVLVGAAGAWLVSMSGWLVRPRHPEHLALAACFEALADFYASIANGPSDAARHRASEAVHTAWVTVLRADTKRNRRTGEARRLRVLCRRALDLFQAAQLLAVERTRPLPSEIPDTVRALAGAVGRPKLVPVMPAVLADTETAAERNLRVVLKAAAQAAGQPAVAEGEIIHGRRPTARERLRAAFDRSSLVPPTALRTGLGVGFAVLAAAVLPVVHPAWVAIAAGAALQGGNVVLDFGRVLQRAIGTLLGVAVIALFFHDLLPDPWVVVVTVALLFGATQTVITRNLAVGAAFVTPVGLFLAAAGRDGAHVGDLASTRVIDTILGLTVGLTASLILWPRASSTRLPRQLGRAIRAEAMLVRATVTGNIVDDPAWGSTRRAARREMLDLWSVYEAALGEFSGRRLDAERLWPAIVTTQRLGYRVMTAPETYRTKPPEPIPEDDLGRLDAYLGELAAAAEERRAPALPEQPDMWGHPVLRQHLKRLGQTIAAANEPVPSWQLPKFVHKRVPARPARLLYGARRTAAPDTGQSQRPARNRGPGDRT